MKKQTIPVIAAVLGLLVAASVAADTDRLYFAAGNRYVVVDPASGSVLHHGRLSLNGENAPGPNARAGGTPAIIPTPGGRFVFFHRPWADTVTVVDAESHRFVRTIELPQNARTVVFSSMGNEVFLPVSDDRFVYLDHRRGEISGRARSLGVPASGNPAFNRRATRIYTSTASGGETELVYVLKSSGEAIAEVDLPSGQYNWQASPNFRFLLGVEEGGDGLVVVAEQARRVTAEIDEEIDPDSVYFSADSETITALTADRRTALVIDGRRGRIRDRITLPEAVDYLRTDVDGRLLAVSGTTAILDVAGQDLRVDVGRYLSNGEASGAEVRAQLVTLKPGQGFACF